MPMVHHFYILQKPLSCFSLNYSLTSSQAELSELNIVKTALASSLMAIEVIEVAGLRENRRYSAVLSASNQFQFSIDNPVRSEEISFGGWGTSGCGLM